jgi:Na+/H+ antiporter NhaD/arsenite permease-like protein
MNDSIVLIFSGVVVDLCVRHKVANSMPYMLSLATTANIGSALTMTGNPQNILIAALSYDDIGWLEFASNMVLPVIAGTTVNSTMMLTYYRAELFPGSTGMADAFRILMTGSKTPEMLAQERGFYARQAANDSEIKIPPTWSLWSKLQVIVVLGFLGFFAGGFDVSTVCICAGVVLMYVREWRGGGGGGASERARGGDGGASERAGGRAGERAGERAGVRASKRGCEGAAGARAQCLLLSRRGFAY